MLELSEQNATDYLRTTGHASAAGEILVQSLSGGIANVVLKIFDTAAGDRVGTDPRSSAQKNLGRPDSRPNKGTCFVLKQPLGKFRTEAEWLVDIDRVWVERDCMRLLTTLLPAGSVPEVLWTDEANHILAMACAPVGAVIWKKQLLAGQALSDAGTHAGMLMAMMHSSTHGDPEIAKRYGDPLLFSQQRIDPYLLATAEKHPDLAAQFRTLGEGLLKNGQCLIHGDFSPKNIFLIRREPDALAEDEAAASDFLLSHLMLLDFEVAFYGHPAFDVATLINHFLLKGFFHHKKWRPYMLLADNFWQTYRNTADPELVHDAENSGGHLLGALLLARIDGKSPVEYLISEPAIQQQVRSAAKAILAEKDPALDHALDTVSPYFDTPD